MTTWKARLTLIGLNILLIAAAEVLLRVAEYGGELDLVVKKSIAGSEIYQINRRAARRYFSGSRISIPEPADETFSLHKSKTTKRIFCLGGSTMAGFPYEYHATAPAFLRERLQSALPQYNIEVINVGVSAVGSFVIEDFLNELLHYEPDLFIIYAGHNEFYGAYGVGSSLSVGRFPWITRLHLALLKFRTYMALGDALGAIAHWFSSDDTGQPTGTLMQQLAEEKLIPLHHELYQAGLELYEENLLRMLRAARDAGVPVIFSALVSNLKDHAPFVSAWGTQTDEQTRQRVLTMLAQGDSAQALGSFEEAIQKYSSALALDSLYALTHYKSGTSQLATGRAQARFSFIRARDLDALRFRASSDFEAALLQVGELHNIPVARVDSAFAEHSAQKIPGNELLLEHLHPNIEGYFLMAKVFAQTIKQHSVLVAERDWNTPESDSVLLQRSTVSAFDRAVGKLRVEFLKRQWPFVTGPVHLTYTPENPIEEIAFKYVRREVDWSDARYSLADYYARNREFELARNECRAVAKVIPYSYNPVFRIAEFYRMEGRRDEAKAAFERSLQIQNNPYAHVKLGLIALEMREDSSAQRHFEEAIAVNKSFPESFTQEMSSAANYLLGVALARQKKFAEARVQAQRALVIMPGNKDAEFLLLQIDTLTRRQ